MTHPRPPTRSHWNTETRNRRRSAGGGGCYLAAASSTMQRFLPHARRPCASRPGHFLEKGNGLFPSMTRRSLREAYLPAVSTRRTARWRAPSSTTFSWPQVGSVTGPLQQAQSLRQTATSRWRAPDARASLYMPPRSHHSHAPSQAQVEAVLERTRQLPPVHPRPPVDLSCEELLAAPDQLNASGGRTQLGSSVNMPRNDSESMFWQELASSLDDKSSREGDA